MSKYKVTYTTVIYETREAFVESDKIDSKILGDSDFCGVYDTFNEEDLDFELVDEYVRDSLTTYTIEETA